MKKVLSITLIFLIAVVFTGCSQVEKIQDSVAIGQSLNKWFQSIEGSGGSLLDNMVKNGEGILYDKNLEIDVSMSTQDGKSININPETFETRQDFINYVENENFTGDWKAFRNYELKNVEDITVRNTDGEEIEVNEKSLSNARTFISLISDKSGNSRDAYGELDLRLYNTEKRSYENYTGSFRITFTEKEENDWYIQKLALNLNPVGE